MARITTSSHSDKSAANLGFETKLWLAADKLRNNVEAAGKGELSIGRVKEVSRA